MISWVLKRSGEEINLRDFLQLKGHVSRFAFHLLAAAYWCNTVRSVVSKTRTGALISSLRLCGVLHIGKLSFQCMLVIALVSLIFLVIVGRIEVHTLEHLILKSISGSTTKIISD